MWDIENFQDLKISKRKEITKKLSRKFKKIKGLKFLSKVLEKHWLSDEVYKNIDVDYL